MNYIPEIIKAVLVIAVFIIAAHTAQVGYEGMVIACLGIIYVAMSIGITRLRLQQFKTIILNTRMLLDILMGADNPYDKANIKRFDTHLSHYYDELKKVETAIVIQYISGGLIALGCIYLIYQSLNV